MMHLFLLCSFMVVGFNLFGADPELDCTIIGDGRAAVVAQFNEKFSDPSKHCKIGPLCSVLPYGFVFDAQGQHAYFIDHGKNNFKLYCISYPGKNLKGKIKTDIGIAFGTMSHFYANKPMRTLGCCQIRQGDNITFVGYTPEKMIVVRCQTPVLTFHRCTFNEASIVCEQSTSGHIDQKFWNTFAIIDDSGAYYPTGAAIAGAQWQNIDFKNKKKN